MAGLCISIFSSSLFLPFSPYHSLLCPFPVLCLPLSSLSLLASLSHSPTFSVSPSPTTLLLSVSSPLRIWGHPQESGHSEVPGDGQVPSCPSLSLCPAAAARTVGKGQRMEATVAKPETGAQVWLGKKRGNKELGERGCAGVRTGKGCPGAVNGSHSRLYEQIWG